MFILEGDSLSPKRKETPSPPTSRVAKHQPRTRTITQSGTRILALYNKVFDAAIAGLSKLDDSALPNQLSSKMPDSLRDYFSSVEVTLGFMVDHDASTAARSASSPN